jgi:drug/metabolite transporter (DMT)-like permease
MGLLTGFLSALAYTSVRSLKAHYDERTVVFSFMFFGTIIPLILMICTEFITLNLPLFALNSFVMPHGVNWLWIFFMGLAAAFGQLYMTRAYFYAQAGLVSTISYSVVLFASFFGILLGDTLPTTMIVAGGLLIVTSGILLSRNK